jgi:hypothetical protein
MSTRFEAPQINEVGEVSNSNGSNTIVPAPGTGMYVYIEKMTISVFRAAIGGGGIVRIQDTDGGVIWTMNADGVKDVILSFGQTGLRLGENKGIQAVVADSQGEQASASISVVGHTSFR